MAVDRVLNFTPLKTFREWLAEYKPGIRVQVDWELLQKGRTPKVEQEVITSDSYDWCTLYFPWFKKGYRVGTPTVVPYGTKPFLVRVPAIRIPDTDDFLVLDGCHRLKELKPVVIVVDYLELRNRDHRYAFNDLLGKAFEE